jgi:hypothetical protein
VLLPIRSESGINATLLKEQESALHPLSGDVVRGNGSLVHVAPKGFVQLLSGAKHLDDTSRTSVQGVDFGWGIDRSKDVGIFYSHDSVF